ncbi:MAG: glycosyltransferase [Streptococcaceae bacterium]|jgi:glycosyltransferase involved in cell wall biosynthesis|nr:glycosyltransferase [Streptococcaceae bacterium]MCH4176013.1 glycosyltransferase [Streptococcaceae bacterium]
MSIKVSVIVTCYNHEQYIEQCLKSIFSQTYSNIDLLVINDGSTDNSDEIIKQVLKESPFENTEYVSQENSGICVTRNLGIDYVINGSAKYLLFVDSDNYLDDDYIQSLFETAEKENGDIIYGDLINAETGEVVSKAKPYNFEAHLESNYIDNCSLIRIEKIGAVRYDLKLNRKKLVDYDFLLNLIITNHAVPIQAPAAQLRYRVLENSISRVNGHDSEKYYYEVYLYILTKYLDSKRDDVVRAIKQNIFNLEARLSDLISHLSDVTNYVHDLNSSIDNLNLEKKEFKNQINSLNVHVNNLNAINSEIENQKQALLQSKAYRLGHFLIRPLQLMKKAINRPEEVKIRLVRGTRRLLKSFKTPFLKLVRNTQRRQNNYTNPNRVLIYVIYESEARLQTYKVLFLEALAKLSKHVLIVVNGTLPPADIDILKQYGEVVARANEGYDTAAFKYGIEYLGQAELAKFDQLLLVNDTNVGPFYSLESIFKQMAAKHLDFWGVSYGEPQADFTSYNPYGIIPVHLQSYFLVIEKSLLSSSAFSNYWHQLGETNSRNKAIGKHETVFTRYFEERGYLHGALSDNNHDSAMYIHPLTMIEKYHVPLVKFTAFANYTNDKFAWQGLKRETEVPALLNYIETNTEYPMSVIDDIMTLVKQKNKKQHILIIDGVENIIPQCTRYRVTNKAEQLEQAGFTVWIINLSDFQLGYAENASHIIIYRAPYSEQLRELIYLAKKYQKPVYYDIDDLVIDTKYTDQLAYTQHLDAKEKLNYDVTVENYGKLLRLCDGAITSTNELKHELLNYQQKVLLNRNVASNQLVEVSQQSLKDYSVDNTKVRIGYFSGSITHNENFDLIKPQIIKLLLDYPEVELHLVGHLEIPKELLDFSTQIVTHDYVDWLELPQLISKVDINIAPLVDTIFNRAKSEIKWLEAALVKVPTVASNIGAFKEMISDGETGLLADENEWYDKLLILIKDKKKRENLALQAYQFVISHCTTKQSDDLGKELQGVNEWDESN